MVKEFALSRCKLPLGGMPRKSVVRIIDHPLNDMKCVERPLTQYNNSNSFQTACVNFVNIKFRYK